MLVFVLNINASELIEKGIWKINVVTQVDGRPKSTPTVYNQCVEDLKTFISVLKPEPNCSVYNTLVTQDKISWDLQCVSNSNTMQGSAKLVKSLRQIKGKIEMRVSIPGTSFSMLTTRKIDATRIENCR